MCAPMAALDSGDPAGIGGDLMHRASPALYSSSRCRLARAPFGSPSRSFSTLRSVLLISIDFRTNGLIVLSIRALTVEGYVRCAICGQASASSLAMLMNSTVSKAPVSSVAFAPAFLYLQASVREAGEISRACNGPA